MEQTIAEVEFRVLDETGRPIGTIAAPTERPVLGNTAPTVYLRRD